MNCQWIDTHCHLNYDYSPKTVADLLREAKEEGVSHFITIGTDLPTISQLEKISESFDEVFHTVGVHPHEAVSLSDVDLQILEKASHHPKCRGIGEIGLDYYYDNSPRDIQLTRLEQQLDLAVKVKQPIVIHSRDGESDLLPFLVSYSKKVDSSLVPGVIHCFTGTYEFGKACLDLGFFISFSGILTFKNAEDIRKSAMAFPIDRLLVETDSPFLAPIPFRGKKCETKMVKITGQKLAEIKNLSPEKVAEQTSLNAKKLFRIC